MSFPTFTLRRASLCARTPPSPRPTQQTRHASLLKRPHRPYQFTQLITLSDGSTYTTRTTSPLAVYVSVKDSRNHALWNPSLASLAKEDDEAGRLKSFREKFGRGWDMEEGEGEGAVEAGGEGSEAGSMMDLIRGRYEMGERRELVGKVEAKKAVPGKKKKA